ncbi:hypothetical protein Tco_0804866, partial [Tanacetum coccineum]
PPTCHAEESEDSDTSGARSTSLDFTAPLSPDHPLTHTSPTLVPFLRRTACMAMRVLHAMSPGLSASIAELVEDDEEEDDDEVEESLDSDREGEYTKEEGLTAEDEGPAAGDEGLATGDEGLATGDEGPGMRVESLSLKGDKAVPEGQQRAAPVMETAVGEPLGLGYGALRHREIASRKGEMPSVFEVGQGSGYVPEPKRPERVSTLRKPTLTT